MVNSLSVQCPHDLQPYAGKLLGALVSGLSDRNAAVRMCYAKVVTYYVCYGYLCSIVFIRKYLIICKGLYI